MLNIFSKEYIPIQSSHKKNDEINLITRQRFFSGKERNLEFLIKKRYDWMKPYLGKEKKIIEFGSGAGLIKEIFPNYDITLTDVEMTPYIDIEVDANNLPSWVKEYNVVICSQMIHHLEKPVKFLQDLQKILKPNSLILINESNLSFAHRFLLVLFQHEGWSFNLNPYNLKRKAKKGFNPMDGNNAISHMIFDKQSKFDKYFSSFEVIMNRYCESFIFILSGGVGKKIFTIQLPEFLLIIINYFDIFFSSIFSKLFPLSRNIVLRKKKNKQLDIN